MASMQQFFVTLNAATPDLFARFHKRTDRHLLRQAINPSAAMLRSGLKTWSIVSLISMHDAELADDRNQVDLKIDPRPAWFFQNTRLSILPPCSILPRLTIHLYAKVSMCKYEYQDTEAGT